MKRIIGIVLIVIGVALVGIALTRHEDEKTIIDIGKLEIKDKNASPSENTTIYYVLAAVCVIGGGVMLSGKRA